jgi:hypothetical protein
MTIRRTIPAALLVIAALLAPVPESARASDETIPPRSWIYPALRDFETLGLVDLAAAQPYTRSEVEAYVDRIMQSLEGYGALTPRQEFLLGRLRLEFQGMENSPEDREDPPVWMMREGRRFFAFDLEIGGAFAKRVCADRSEADGLLIPTFLLGMGGAVTMEMNYIATLGPEWEDGCDYRGYSRVRSWRGLTSEYERGYVAFSGKRWRLQLGRDYIQWGPLTPDGLLMSSSARSHDHLGFDISMGRFTLRTFQAVLDSYMPRRLAGHRLEIRLPARIQAGLGETVLYTGRYLDWAYLIPFGPFYANQYNEKEDDNILWSFDLKVPVTRGLVLSGEFLIDDLQYESDPPAPDKTGWTVRADCLFMPWGHDLGIKASYTRIDIYTYSHKDSLMTAYVTGDGEKLSNTIIGDQLGPDADRWRLRVYTPLHPRALLHLDGSWSRFGEGSDMRQWEWGEDPDPPFPSGEVTRQDIYSAGLTIDLSHGSFIEAAGGIARRSGAGEEDDEGFGNLSIVWDF